MKLIINEYEAVGCRHLYHIKSLSELSYGFKVFGWQTPIGYSFNLFSLFSCFRRFQKLPLLVLQLYQLSIHVLKYQLAA